MLKCYVAIAVNNVSLRLMTLVLYCCTESCITQSVAVIISYTVYCLCVPFELLTQFHGQRV